jgi:hypothetical protein
MRRLEAGGPVVQGHAPSVQIGSAQMVQVVVEEEAVDGSVMQDRDSGPAPGEIEYPRVLAPVVPEVVEDCVVRLELPQILRSRGKVYGREVRRKPLGWAVAE